MKIVEVVLDEKKELTRLVTSLLAFLDVENRV